MALEPLGAEIRQAANGTELWRLLEGGDEPDLVITDFRMPPPDGLEVLARARGRGSRVPFLVVTGFVDDAVLAGAGLFGADVLIKPFNAEQLLQRVRRLVARGPGRDEEPG